MAKKAEIFYINHKKYNCVKNGKPYFRKTAMLGGRQRDFYGDGEKDAIRKIEEARKAENSGLVYTKKSAKIGPTMKYWLYSIKRVDKNLKPSSFARYENTFRNHIAEYPIAEVAVSRLDATIFQEYVTQLYEEEGMSGGSIEATVKVWRMFYVWAIAEGYTIKNPTRNVSLPGARTKGKRTIEIFPPEDRKALAEYMEKTKYQYDTLIYLAFATGMRQGELLGLKWEDLDGDVIHVVRSTTVASHIEKNGTRTRYREIWDTKTTSSVRDIPLLPSTKAMLDEHREKQKAFFDHRGEPQPEFLFTTETGALVDPSSFHKSYVRLLKRAGLTYRKFHAIRHTFATEAVRRGVNIKDLQTLLGHSAIETTYIYVQADTRSQKNAIAMMGELI